MHPELLAYIGPETALPAMSLLAAVAGLGLGMGKWLARPFVRGYRSLRGLDPDGASPEPAEEPETVATESGPAQE